MYFPLIGQGIGDYVWLDDHVRLIQTGIDFGLNLLDTAESYGNGSSECIIGKSIQGRRDKVIIATKFAPEHSQYNQVITAAENSLKRLSTDYIDIYQLHWPNNYVPFFETMRAMSDLVTAGKIRYIGVCNLGKSIIRNLKQDFDIKIVQTEYNLFDRSAEEELIPYCLDNSIKILAYSPLDQGHLVNGIENKKFIQLISEKYHKTVSQVILRWMIYKGVIPIPKTAKLDHLICNYMSYFKVDDADMELIDEYIKTDIVYISPKEISVSLQGERAKNTYVSLKDAINNTLGFVPSPNELSLSFQDDDKIKPVRVVNDNGKFILIEGRVRYWAWVIAFGFDKPIPALVREDWPWKAQES